MTPPLIPDFPLGNREQNVRLALALAELFLSHGSRGSFVGGCRCDWCIAANRQYDRTHKVGSDGIPRWKKARMRAAERQDQFRKSVLEEEENGL